MKKWRGVQRWSLQCYCSPRGEVVVQAVVERTAVASRVDNLLHAWRKLVVKLLPGVQAKQLKRGVWLQDTLVDVRVMVEAWEAACAKLGAEAAVDGGAVRCSYLEPALPSASVAPSASAPSDASAAAPNAAAAARAPASALPSAAVPAPKPEPRALQGFTSAPPAQGQPAQEKPRAPLLVTLG